MIAYHYSELPDGDDRFVDAIRQALPKCRGAYGVAVLCLDYPDTMIGARGFPFGCWFGDDANFIASDASAFVGRAKEAVLLNDGELAILNGSDFRITNLEGQEAVVALLLIRSPRRSSWVISIPTWRRRYMSNPLH